MRAAASEALEDLEVFDLGPAERIPPGEGKTFHVAGRAVAVFRTRSGALHATQAACPHRQGPLADGLLDEQRVICPLHSFKFDLSTGAAAGNDCGALTVYSVKLGPRGQILLDLRSP
jgi:nitrite reductase (NADH) small subunit